MLNGKIIAALLMCLVFITPAHAQDTATTRDPWDLAHRLLGYNAPYALPDITPLYDVGDTAEFWVSKANAEQRSKITAELASGTPNVYVWVEEGIDYNERAMNNIAAQIDQIWFELRRLRLYGQPTILPGTSTELADSNSLVTVPDVDADPHLFVLYATDLGDNNVLFNLLDSLPADISPFSNQHEMIYVNVSAIPGASPSDGIFVSLLSRGIYEMLVNYHTPDQAQWLREALSLFVARQLEFTTVAQNALPAFLQAPNTPLIQPSNLSLTLPIQGVQQLFLDYLNQRFGIQFVQDLFLRSGEGMTALDAALADNELIDPVTLDIFTARDVFADFVIANALSPVLDRPFGDGRYTHTVAQFPAELIPTTTNIQDDYDEQFSEQSVNQFGTQYFYILNTDSASFNVAFNGREITPMLDMPASDDNHFYWSGRGHNQSTTLTRAFDLSDVDSATLTFDTWFDLANEWTYGYIEISMDGGESWALVSTDNSTTTNRNGAAYGAGYTGISNPEGPRPFPILGIVIDSNGMTINDITPDGPAATSDLVIGDLIVGYEGQEWPGTPNVIALLSNYAPGDTLTFLVERDGERLDIPVILGAHPTRIVEPEPLWLSESIDLTAFAGGEILVRFEYVSMPDGQSSGFAIDNIAIPEIDFSDDAEREPDGWILSGWQRLNNEVDQKFLVQAAVVGSTERLPSVRPLIGVDDNTTSGEWAFDVIADEVVLIAVSGLSDNTDQPALFDLTVSEAE